VLHAVAEVVLLFELGENEVRLRHFSLRQVKSPVTVTVTSTEEQGGTTKIMTTYSFLKDF
jgi:hypothetical protein